MSSPRQPQRSPRSGAAGRRRARGFRALVAALLTGTLLVALSACGLHVPTDPRGTLDRVTGGELRVGVSPDPGLVELSPDGTPSGSLPTLVRGFAETIHAKVTWSVASEETLVQELDDGTIDMAIGGFTADTPWTDKVGVTRGYQDIPGARQRKLVIVLPLGENAAISAVESYLDEEVGG